MLDQTKIIEAAMLAGEEWRRWQLESAMLSIEGTLKGAIHMLPTGNCNDSTESLKVKSDDAGNK